MHILYTYAYIIYIYICIHFLRMLFIKLGLIVRLRKPTEYVYKLKPAVVLPLTYAHSIVNGSFGNKCQLTRFVDIY